MDKTQDLTSGSVKKTLLRFVLPYLLACFLQTFYGMVDLFVVGLYNGAAATTAVSIGSQVMHMLTVMIAGLTMGITVMLGRHIGAKNDKNAVETVGTAIVTFALLSVFLTVVLYFGAHAITVWMLTPAEAQAETFAYLKICFLGLPFIIIYNVISGIFRGAGDSRRPMAFVGVACAVNVMLDFVFVGAFRLGATGAALATMLGQGTSALVSFLVLQKRGIGIPLSLRDIRIRGSAFRDIVSVGAPIALQDGLIQISFIVITMIANSRGLIAATSVGIVEKIVGFVFLVPSAFLSAISAITAQNMGAGKPERARETLRFALVLTVAYGCIIVGYCRLFPETPVAIFTGEKAVLLAGSEYLRSYIFDVIFASVHFCFSGFFCGDRKSYISFLHNIIAIVSVRIPGAYLASVCFPETLYPMGWAAPAGSLLSSLICVAFYAYCKRREHAGEKRF